MSDVSIALVATLTLSNAAVLSDVLSCDVTAKPAVPAAAIVTFVLASCVHVEPSGEYDAVNVAPDRTSRTHCGGMTGLIQPVTLIVAAPVVERTSNATPFVGVSR